MRGLGVKTTAMREAIKGILAGIQPATVRAVCYQLFVRKLIKNMSKSCTNGVSGHLVVLRENGGADGVPWEWVVDEGREIERVNCWRDFDHHFNDFVSEHALDPWLDQPEQVFIVSEKGTVSGTLLGCSMNSRSTYLSRTDTIARPSFTISPKGRAAAIAP